MLRGAAREGRARRSLAARERLARPRPARSEQRALRGRQDGLLEARAAPLRASFHLPARLLNHNPLRLVEARVVAETVPGRGGGPRGISRVFDSVSS